MTKLNLQRSNERTLMSVRGTEQISAGDGGDTDRQTFMRVMCEKCSHIGSVPTDRQGFIRCKRCGRRQRVYYAAKKMRTYRGWGDRGREATGSAEGPKR